MHTDSLINPRAGAEETQIRFLSSNHPDVVRARAQIETSDGGRDWVYIGTFSSGGSWCHEFYHPLHPLHQKRVFVRVPGQDLGDD